MKREHNSDSYIDWLKSLGCLVYLPLSEEGDLQDRISGLSLQLTGNGSMAWDANEGMYKITQPNSLYQYVAKLDNGLTKTDFHNNNYTTIHTVKKITNSSSKMMNTMSVQSANEITCAATSATYNGTGRTNAWPSTAANVAYISNHGASNRTAVQNGSVYATFAEYTLYLPSNWVINGTGITIGCCRGSNCYGVQYYMKNVYLFNTALDLATIRKIQGYE